MTNEVPEWFHLPPPVQVKSTSYYCSMCYVLAVRRRTLQDVVGFGGLLHSNFTTTTVVSSVRVPPDRRAASSTTLWQMSEALRDQIEPTWA
jgi:hypothetical protein